MHDWLVWLVFEVAVPTTWREVTGGPALHLLQLFRSWSGLDAGLNAVGGQRACAFEVPFLEDLLLDLWVAPDKVIERLCVWLGSVRREVKIVILEVETNTWEIDDRLDTYLPQLGWIANARSLKDEWRAECAASNNDLLSGFEYATLVGLTMDLLGRHSSNSDSNTVLDDDLIDLGVALDVQVLMFGASGMNISRCSIRPAASVSIDPLKPLLGTVASDKVLEIIRDWEALRFCRSQEILHDGVLIVSE